MFELGFEGLGMMGRMGVVWERGVAGNFVHPLRAALRLHASPSQSEGEGRRHPCLPCEGRSDCVVAGVGAAVMATVFSVKLVRRLRCEFLVLGG